MPEMEESATQISTIGFYKQIQYELELCPQPELNAHYQHILLSLQRIIESFGPSPEYYEWLVQFSPRNFSNQFTFTIDL